VITGTTTATIIWPKVVPNHSITDLIEDFDWVACAIGSPFSESFARMGNKNDSVPKYYILKEIAPTINFWKMPPESSFSTLKGVEVGTSMGL
jgi:hypothetical protein